MPFRPLHDRHAIQEVVFVLTFGREFEPAEVEAVVQAHDRWREELPRVTRFTGQRIEIQDADPPQIKPTEEGTLFGVAFDAVKRDGSIDWRLRLQQNWMGVNCLSYTGWNQIWPTSRGFLEQVGGILINPKLPVVGAALQYIDLFIWEDDIERYRADQLFRADSDLIPKSIWDKGPLWHLHQGWFEKEDLPAGGRRLEKVHIDAVEREGIYQTKVDMTLRHDLADVLPSYKSVFGANGEGPCIDAMFTAMHTQCSRLLKAYITDEMAERISLNA